MNIINEYNLPIFQVAIVFLVMGLLLYALQGFLVMSSSLFFSQHKRKTEATRALFRLLEVEPESVAYKEDKQLQSFFNKKGDLHYHAFTPNGEYYIQFQFKGNKVVNVDSLTQSSVNLIGILQNEQL